MPNNHWKEWFVFSKRDRNAAIILLCILGLIILLPYLLPAKKLDIHIDKDLQAELDAYSRADSSPTPQNFYTSAIDTTVVDSVKHNLFFFDPNTLAEEGFIQLGLSQKVVHTIINYRSKGGYFKTPEDLRKIYGLSKTDADRLIPYVRIAQKTSSQKNETANDQPTQNASSHQYKKIDINTANAEEWKAFPGIGDVIANRIIKFRTSVGGFKSIDQVGKTYGLGDSIFQSIKPYLYLKDTSGTQP